MINLVSQRWLIDSTPTQRNNTSLNFLKWLRAYDNPYLQLDTETNIVDNLYGWKGYLKGKNKDFTVVYDQDGNKIPEKRLCYYVQIGDFEGKEQWIFDVYGLNYTDFQALFAFFVSPFYKIIHNSLFDVSVIKFNFGFELENTRDTYLASIILYMGLEVGEDLPKGWHSLAGCLNRYLNINLDKTEQTTFSKDFMYLEQLEYAAIDVAPLGMLYSRMYNDLKRNSLLNTFALENALVKSYSDSMCENLYLYEDEWKSVMAENLLEVQRLEKEFFSLMLEYFPQECVDLGFIQGSDTYNFNWNSSSFKRELFYHLYGVSLKNLKEFKEYVKTNPSATALILYLNRDFTSLENYLISNYFDYLEKNNIFIPKNKVLINIKSPHQKLKLFRLIKPELENVDKEQLNKIKDHPLAKTLIEYNAASKLYTSYGQGYLDAISPDKQFRVSSYSQILVTGRSSMKMLQLLPGKAKYRNPFKPNSPLTGVREDGHKWVVVGADYASQEAVVAATFCEEETLLKAIAEGCDFHSTCASLMFPYEWKKLGGEEKPKGKPENKILKKLRDSSKTTSFGLFYGKTIIGLAESLNIPGTTEDLINLFPVETEEFLLTSRTEFLAYCNGKETQKAKHDFLKLMHYQGKYLPEVETADDLINRFFSTFPSIHRTLMKWADTGVSTLTSRTPGPINRRRIFPKPSTNGEENSIRRAAMNTPIQGSSADMTKYAICIIKAYIKKNKLGNKLKFILPLHDEIRYIAREDFAEEALKIIVLKMEEAAEFILGNKLLKAEGEITEIWEK
jgi:hypothetical protein